MLLSELLYYCFFLAIKYTLHFPGYFLSENFAQEECFVWQIYIILADTRSSEWMPDWITLKMDTCLKTFLCQKKCFQLPAIYSYVQLSVFSLQFIWVFLLENYFLVGVEWVVSVFWNFVHLTYSCYLGLFGTTWIFFFTK